ncbi:phage holin family protein [Blastococcus sp. PRF04-17]|uniref:phage holin family protein n=1 Tax=Blastococcus sp. PRF04-17 TaxID=2933797 RepID=UPI001FF50935|nr:phage holin family protein [Blastococcus sp. PRF04-17]UOY00642.1 phage holin family protein [Blastococcus sp. PRF04-17]
MIKFAIKVVILAAAFFFLTKYDVLPGLNVEENPDGPLGVYGTYLWIGLIFGVVNAFVGPVLRVLSLPFVLLTLGLFLIVINAALLGLTALLTDRLTVDGFGTAILGGLILAVVGWVADQLLDR